MLQTQYRGSRPFGFRQEGYWGKTCRHPFLGLTATLELFLNNFEKLCSFIKLQQSGLEKEVISRFFYTIQCKIVTGQLGRRQPLGNVIHQI